MSSRSRIVVLVAFSGERFLMVNNPARGWEFPGGKVEDGERPEEAVIREAREEAGLDISEPTFIGEINGVLLYTAEIMKFSENHEFARKLFHSLPKDLAFPREEGEHFVFLAKSNRR